MATISPNGVQTWPTIVRTQPWPAHGTSYTYEHRGYVRPEKLERWLQQAFGARNSKYIVFNGRIYVKSPRRPTEEELEWLMDRSPDTAVYVAELGRELRLNN